MPDKPLFSWLNSRSAGILLHPTSLPGPYGIGTFGPSAIEFLDFLQAAKVRYWQVCPLGPTGFGDSPYQSFSTFAGNPYLIDLTPLHDAGLLTPQDLAPLEKLPDDHTEFGDIYLLRWPVLRKAFDNWKKNQCPDLYGSFEDFANEQDSWLDGYAGFMALKAHYKGKPWQNWPRKVRSLADAKADPLWKKIEDDRAFHTFTQYLFFGQWELIRAAARERNVEIIGDIPIFVALDSADTWAAPELFDLKVSGKPNHVAGVPPDYFSPKGQLWGNPLYKWKTMKEDGYAWWLERLRVHFTLFDVVRIDHFRGFASFWKVPAKAETAQEGKWTKGPGLDLFQTFHDTFPDARLIAEDLGIITDDVRKLLRDTGLPGMAVLQFAFGGDEDNLYLPHNLKENEIVYSGTHDNDTTRGWYESAPENVRDHVRRTLSVSGDDIAWDLLRAAYRSTCRLAIVPMQDVLSLGSEARFNTPGEAMGNWQWRLTADQLDQAAREAPRLAQLASETTRS